jgi:hypothetical protein
MQQEEGGENEDNALNISNISAEGDGGKRKRQIGRVNHETRLQGLV